MIGINTSPGADVHERAREDGRVVLMKPNTMLAL